MIGYIYLTINDINEVCYVGKRQKPYFDRAYKGSGTHLEYKRKQRDRLPKVAQIDKITGEIVNVWDNWCVAGKALVKTHRLAYVHISECCKGKRKTAYGYVWEVVKA